MSSDDWNGNDEEPFDEVFAHLRPAQVPVPPARSGTTLRPPAATRAAPETPPVEEPPDEPAPELPPMEPQPAPRSPRTRWIVPGILAAAALVIGFFLGTRTSSTPPEPSLATHAAEPPIASSDARPSASVPAPPIPEAPPADLKQCVEQVIPLGRDVGSPELDTVCREADAKQVVDALGKLIVGSKGVPRNTQIRWASLGSFKMAGAQLLRSTCCRNAATLSGPKGVATCKLDAALAAIHDGVASGGDLRAASQTYFEALDCLFKTKLFDPTYRPQSFEQTAFLDLAI